MLPNHHKSDRNKQGIKLKKLYIASSIFTILLICFLLILAYIVRKPEEVTHQPPTQPKKPTHAVQQQDEPKEPEPSDSSKNSHGGPPPEYIEPEPRQKPSLDQLIRDLKDDDIWYNADNAIHELASRLPDDKKVVKELLSALYSDDWQQRQIAGYILARWAKHTDLSNNRQFLKIMVEALTGEKPIVSMCGQNVAEIFLCGQGHLAADILQSALTSENERQRAYAAFILAVSMDIPPESRKRVADILSDPSEIELPSNYQQGAWYLSAVEAEAVGHQMDYPADMASDQIYVVQKGDILSDIAWQFNTSWRVLAMYNCLYDPNLIEPGLEIFIPGSFSQRTWEEQPEFSVIPVDNYDHGELLNPVYEHVLYPGETLKDVAKQYGYTEEIIMAINGISDPSVLKPGTKLIISTQRERPILDIPVYEHVLYPGETFQDIARQYGCTEEIIMTINGISDPETLRPGIKLLIPVPE